MTKTGILGGTFDPVHDAHLAVATMAQSAAGLDHVVFMPAGTPPHKDHALAAAQARLDMVRLAIAGRAGFEASDFEINAGGVGYTADTLQAYGRAHPEERLHFIMGGDSLLYLDQWRYPERLMALACMVAVYRPGSSYAALEAKRDEILRRFGGEILLVECPGMDVSSTDIRAKAAAGLPLAGLVPPAVEQYIRENGLYREGA